MNICLSHTTALRFWRSAFAAQLAGPREPFYRADTPNRKPMTLPAPVPHGPELDKLIGARKGQRAYRGEIPATVPQIGMIELSLLAPLGGVYPCHAITTAVARRSKTDHVVTHVCATPLPQSAAVWLTDALSVVSPELLFVQMAETLPFPQLVMLGYELCGYYALPQNAKDATLERRQLTNVTQLDVFLKAAPHLRGRKAAETALRYVLDGSASPMETKLAMLLTLPFARGGYNLPKPQMNANATLKKNRAAETVTCDMLWREASLVVEYDGDEGHASHAQRTRDARRREDLAAAGFDCTVVTYGRLMDSSDMDAIAAKIARSLGYRPQPRVANYPQRKAALRQALLGE